MKAGENLNKMSQPTALHTEGTLEGDALNVSKHTSETGKRISQKLLRNCVKFLSIIHDVLKIAPMEYVKQSSDEVDIRGPESKYDSRKINSYPSKVHITRLFSDLIFEQIMLFSGMSPHHPT